MALIVSIQLIERNADLHTWPMPPDAPATTVHSPVSSMALSVFVELVTPHLLSS